MRSIIKSFVILAVVFTVAIATQAQEENSEMAEKNEASAKDDVPIKDDVEKIGEPQKCINSSRLARATVVNDKSVDFTLRNGKVYRNKLLTRCPIIRNNDRITYRQESSTRLCKGDKISSLETISDRLQSFGLCGLGEFQQIEAPKSE